MADLATIQKIRDQLIIEGSEEGWHWETNDFCCENYLPSREAALSDFNQFVTSGELDTELARPRYNTEDLDAITRQALLEGEEPDDPDLFAEMANLEGNLSIGQILRLREEVLVEGAGLSRYIELMKAELYGVSA